MVIAVVFWLVGLFDRVIMPFVTRAGAEITVPDLRHMSISDADSVCQLTGIEIVNEKKRLDDRYPPGVVLDQYPPAGSIVKSGRRMELVISERSALIPCPDVVGRSPREAVIMADSTGLNVDLDGITYSHSDKVPEGVVLAQNPSPLTGLTRGSVIRITVSLGDKPIQSVVPDLVGRNISDVRFQLAKQSLRLGRIERYPDRTLPVGSIMSQYPEAGSIVGEHSTVDVQMAVEPVGVKEENQSGQSSNDVNTPVKESN